MVLVSCDTFISLINYKLTIDGRCTAEDTLRAVDIRLYPNGYNPRTVDICLFPNGYCRAYDLAWELTVAHVSNTITKTYVTKPLLLIIRR